VAHGQRDLLDFMGRYWVADRGDDEKLWAHEYNKHATCINTLAPACYGEQEARMPGREVVDYFARAASLHKMLDTYTALQHAGITPSAEARYALADVVRSLERFSGGKVVLRCAGKKRDRVHEVWYVYFVQGSLQSGEFVPAQELGAKESAGNCAPMVRYPPKKTKGEAAGRRSSR
jgi:ribonuclease T2